MEIKFTSLNKEIIKLNLDQEQTIYICGPTVYDHVHIGNVRLVIIFNVYLKALQELKIKYNYIHNITDIDDKIIEKAKQLLESNDNKIIKNKKDSEKDVACFFENEYWKSWKSLNLIMPNKTPLVINELASIINFIERLIKNGNAYVLDGNVFFKVDSIKNYGAISNQNLNELIDTTNLDINKEDKKDFALWKKTNDGIKFSSPWGEGRPGWHTECVTFIDKYFNGKQITIHGGGIDLKFPHHENENAQFQALYHNSLTKIWLHNGLINYNNQKMSKSQHNLIYLHDFLNEYSPNILKYIYYNSHYHNHLNINENSIQQAKVEIKRIDNLKLQLSKIKINKLNSNLQFKKKIYQYLFDDLNLSPILFELIILIKKINKIIRNQIDGMLDEEVANFYWVINLLNLN